MCNHNVKIHLVSLALFLFSAIRVSAQCATQYTDGYLDSAGVHASITLTDNYINANSGCVPGVQSNVVHTYHTSVTVTSPKYRTTTGGGGGNQHGGSSSGYSSATAILPFPYYDGSDDSDWGFYLISGHANIVCNVMGSFYNATATSSAFVATPSSHTYPQAPFSSCRVTTVFDAPRGTKKHGAQDVKYTGMAVGAPVAAMEAGTVHQIISGKAHASGTDCPAAQPNAIGIKVGKDGPTTWYRHVMASPDLSEGKPVTAGQQIGTADLSGCTTGVHTHIERWSAPTVKDLLNFTITGCAGSGGTGNPFADAQDDPYDETSFDD